MDKPRGGVTEMKPALTAEEWTEWREKGWLPTYSELGSKYRHGCAALCLEEQPFGFTREDVEKLRAMASKARESSMDAALKLSDDLVETVGEASKLIETQDDLEYDSDFLRSLADRIEKRMQQ